MRKAMILGILTIIVIILVSFTGEREVNSMRRIYARPPAEWPEPSTDPSVTWKELGVLPDHPLKGKEDSLAGLILLGKTLFFDTRLSGSGKISCASCHNPGLSWTDHRELSLGHDGVSTKRNSPTIQNVWFFTRLFWDGRSSSLEDQAFGPINSESEMNGDMPGIPMKLRKIRGYAALFDSAYGDPSIGPDGITGALAVFQRTIVSADSRFDKFLKGDSKTLTNPEIRGLHLFRGKARCMNCHNGPLFTDNQFHQNGFSGNDAGLFFVTHREEDRGKLKTPSLRDVGFTGPWMHDGKEKTLEGIIEKYNRGSFAGSQGTDPLIRPLGLSKRETRDLLAFLKAISAPPLPFDKPVMPE